MKAFGIFSWLGKTLGFIASKSEGKLFSGFRQVLQENSFIAGLLMQNVYVFDHNATVKYAMTTTAS